MRHNPEAIHISRYLKRIGTWPVGSREDVLLNIAYRVEVTERGCWQWLLAKSKDGYATACYGGKRAKAHSMFYRLLVGPIPDGLEFDHLCRNRACVRPDHLEPVTHAENVRRRPTPTHCPHGHEFTPRNTYVNPQGSKVCRACKADAHRRKQELRRAA